MSFSVQNQSNFSSEASASNSIQLNSSSSTTPYHSWNHIDVDMDLVTHLISMGFSVPRISCLIDVSERTLRRRLQEINFRIREKYTKMSDYELDCKIFEILQQFPTIGLRNIYGHLLRAEIRVQHDRLYQSYRRVMICVGNPFRRVIYRRKYYVRAPLSLWHLDGNHKLIRWKIVIHAGVDGYSRTAVFINCSPDNKASSVFQKFRSAIEEYGCPSRLRIDGGGENVLVAEYMIQKRGEDRGSVISGKSVHNNRVERLWRDVFESATVPFYNMLTEMEGEGILDVNNETDIFCVHFLIFDLLERTLQGFREAWNNHPLRTERNMTPNMLFTSGLIMLSNEQENSCDIFTELIQEGTDLPPLTENGDDSDELNDHRNTIIDENYETPFDVLHHVDFPLYRCPLNDTGLTVLESKVDSKLVELANFVETYLYLKSCVRELMLS